MFNDNNSSGSHIDINKIIKSQSMQLTSFFLMQLSNWIF